MNDFLNSKVGEVCPDPSRRLHTIFIPTDIIVQGKEAIDRYYRNQVKLLRATEISLS